MKFFKNVKVLSNAMKKVKKIGASLRITAVNGFRSISSGIRNVVTKYPLSSAGVAGAAVGLLGARVYNVLTREDEIAETRAAKKRVSRQMLPIVDHQDSVRDLKAALTNFSTSETDSDEIRKQLAVLIAAYQRFLRSIPFSDDQAFAMTYEKVMEGLADSGLEPELNPDDPTLINAITRLKDRGLNIKEIEASIQYVIIADALSIPLRSI